MVGLATGTGKTAAFTIPMLSRSHHQQGTPGAGAGTHQARAVAEAFGRHGAIHGTLNVLPVLTGSVVCHSSWITGARRSGGTTVV